MGEDRNEDATNSFAVGSNLKFFIALEKITTLESMYDIGVGM